MSRARPPAASRINMTITIGTTLSVDKYLVSPLTRLTETGHYAASVSIRSGRGSGSHDRVLRFAGRFATHEAAQRYALQQGMGWLRRHRAPDHHPDTSTARNPSGQGRFD